MVKLLLGYTGSDIVTNRGNLLIEQKVYQRYHTTKDLQFVMVCPLGTQDDVKDVEHFR
jgi:hypothetical protein